MEQRIKRVRERNQKQAELNKKLQLDIDFDRNRTSTLQLSKMASSNLQPQLSLTPTNQILNTLNIPLSRTNLNSNEYMSHPAFLQPSLSNTLLVTHPNPYQPSLGHIPSIQYLEGNTLTQSRPNLSPNIVSTTSLHSKRQSANVYELLIMEDLRKRVDQIKVKMSITSQTRDQY